MVLCVGPLGPPTTGASLVTERFLREFDDEITLTKCNIGATTVRNRFWRQPGRIAAAAHGAWMTLRKRPSAVYISVPAGISAVLLMPALLAARATRTPMYLHHHSFAYLHARQRLFAVILGIAGRAVHVALCDLMATRLRAVYPRIRVVHVLSNAAFVPPAATVAAAGARGGAVQLAHLSNLSVEKGLERVLATTVELNESGHDAFLRLGGPATGERELTLIATYADRLGDRLDVLGPIAQGELDKFFSGVDIFLFPSAYRNEAQPLVVLEALAHGVPCITSTAGCLGTHAAVTSLPDLTVTAISRAVTERPIGHGPIRSYADEHREARKALIGLIDELADVAPPLGSISA